jgi:hypothetical protein
MRDTCAALALRLGVDADKVIGHKEYAGIQGKWDPGNVDMNWFRDEVAKDMRGEFRDKARRRLVPPAVAVAIDPCGLRAPENPRSDRVLLEEIWTVLRGPGGNGWPQLGGKSLVDFLALTADVPIEAPLAAASSDDVPAVEAPAKNAPAKRVTSSTKRAPTKRGPTKKKVSA